MGNQAKLNYAKERSFREHFKFVRCRPTPIGVSPASQAAGAATQTKPEAGYSLQK